MKIEDYILNVPDFPKKGINFKDITPILNNPVIFEKTINQMAEFIKKTKANVLVAPEARGFVFAAPLAYKLGLRLVLIRKPGKLPREVYDVSYDLEYGQNHLQIHKEDLKKTDKVVIVDDVLATGGTLEAIKELVEMNNASVVGISVLIDIQDLHHQNCFPNIPVDSLIKY